MSNVSMSSPWTIYAKKVEALFAGDKDVTVKFDNDAVKLSVYVTGMMGKKAEAIEKLLPKEVAMGNVTLTIDVIPADNDEDEISYEELVKIAFNGNTNFAGIASQGHGIFGNVTYGLFSDSTVQFYTDDLTQYGGMDTMVIADIAREVLGSNDNFYFSTEV